MGSSSKTKITVFTNINASLEKVWKQFNEPGHIVNWCFASDDWHAPAAENDFREGGKSTTTMAAKDGSFSFDFSWIYTKIKDLEILEYTLEDGRTVAVSFQQADEGVLVSETFEPENENSLELQKAGWQAILDNFKRYVEQN
jgi:uncharacterized protein YndB with AHSA1/START domain